ncbi:MAG TPA: hypothetical protein DCP28_09945, partial [Cytophagales bacterium]|nr:hypothetical protein [Cytophagales bacterium]
MNISTPGGRIWLPLLLLLCSASTTFGFQNFTDYVITNTDSSGAGSLHEALTAIDGQAGAYRITFDPSLKAQTIPYNVLMNNLVDTLVINGDIDGDKIPDVTLDGGQDRAGIHNHSLNAYLELRSVRISNVHQWAVFPYTFRFNTAASILVEDCILENNEGSWFRLFSNGGSVTLTVNNTQFGNASNLEPSLYEGFGEGVQATFTNVTVQGNNRPDYYPGVMFYQREGFLHLRNSLIYDNQESFIIYAEGLNGEDAEVTLTHVTIANNEITEPSSPYSGPSGVIGVGLARVIINNSLIAANPTVSSTFANFYDNQEGGSITLNNSIAINSAPGYFTDFNNDDYTLADNSPAIDTGSFALIDGLTTDLLGNTRPSNGLLPDVGAFEKQVLAAPAVYTVTNTLASGAGSLNNILDQIHQQTGSHFITFDPGLIGQTIPWNRDLFLNGNLFIEGDLNGDGESDITLTSNGQPAGITTATSGLLLELYNLVFDSFRGSQNGPQVITFNHQGEVRIDGCDFLNSPDTWLLLNHPTDVITLTANDLRFEGNSDDYAMAYLGNGENITATFTNCIAQNNVSSVGSSRLFYAITSDIIVKNSLITDNLVGRGISSTSANVTIVPSSKIIHTTIANNTIPGSSGLGMVVSLSGIVSLENSLVVGNKDQGGTVRNTFVGAAYGTLLTTGSVVADDITGYFKDAGNQDYRLASESPAKNVGLETLIGDLTEDLAGNDRPTVSTAPDAGAYESLEATFWVTNIQNSGPGSLTDVINQVRGQPGDFLIRFDPVLKGSDVPFLTELWVGEGKVTVDGDVDGDQVADISLKNGASSGYFDLFTAGSELELRHLVVKGLRPFQSSAIQAQVSGKVTIVGCEFRNISRTIITGTTATQDSLIFDISNTRFISNTRDDFSGVLFTISPQTKAYFKNCIIQGNSPNGVRRLIYLSGSSAEFENCLITDNNTNWAIDYYGTVNTDTSELIIRHTTITNNTPSIRDDIHAVSVRDGKVGIFNSLIVGNTSADGVSRDLSIAGNALTNGTIANQVNDGFFTDEAGGDYTLATNSPAVDAGDPTFIGGLTTDLAGNIRPQGLPDAGAFEKLIDP